MSLINQMLKDLESRNLKDTYDEEKMLGGVQSQSANPPGHNKTIILLSVFIILTLVLVAGWFLWKPGATVTQASSVKNDAPITEATDQYILASMSATDQPSGAELTITLSAPAQGLILRHEDKQAILEIKSANYSEDLALPLTVTQLFPGLQLSTEGKNTVIIIPLNAGEVMNMKDASGKMGQIIVLTKTEKKLVVQTHPAKAAGQSKQIQEVVSPVVKPEPKPASKVASREEKEESLPIVKKAVPLSPQQQALSYYNRAQRALGSGESNKAISQLRQSIGLYPLPQSYMVLAGLLVNQGNQVEARNILERGHKSLPDDSDIAYLLARLQVDAGQHELARGSLISALAAGRSNAEYLALLGAVSQQLKRYPESVQAYVEALKIKPGQSNWWMGLGMSLEGQPDKKSQAIEAYYKALSTGLGDQLQNFVLGRIQVLEGAQQ